MFSLDVSSDGRLVAAACRTGACGWDIETGRDAFTVDPGPAMAPFMDVTWSADGDLLAIVANDGRTGRATVVDRGGRAPPCLEEFGIALTPMTFTPDGEQLMTVRLPTGPLDFGQGEVVMWDWRDDDVVPIIDAAVRGEPARRATWSRTWQTTSDDEPE